MHTWRKVGCCLAAAVALSASAVTIQVDQVKQRYPWNGIVDIDYTLTYQDGESLLNPTTDRIWFKVINNAVEPATTNVALCLDKFPVPVSAGSHRIAWNANADKVNFVSKNVTVVASVSRYLERYMIVNLTEKDPDTGLFRVNFTIQKPEGGFDQDLYKGDKMVFRLVPPGAFTMGSPTTEVGRCPRMTDFGRDTEVQHPVMISKPMYVGIFPVTQKQWSLLVGNLPNSQSSAGNYKPVSIPRYSYARGGDWPTQTGVGSGSFIGILRAKTGYDFDLPTEAQWEYACRAGTTSAFNNGTESPDGLAQYNQTALADVGTFAPNAWGLYDMHGNIWEVCLDYWSTSPENLPVVDPVGPTTGEKIKGSVNRVIRGGRWAMQPSQIRSANRDGMAIDQEYSTGGNGIRVFLTVK